MQSHFTGKIISRFRSVADKKIAPLILTLFLVAAYILLFHFFYQIFGWWTLSFAWVYIGLSVWFWGLKGGLLAHILTIFLNLFLLKTIGEGPSSSPIPTIVSLLLVVALGRLRDLGLKFSEELNKREKAEELLHKAHDGLERLVAERTSDLEAAVDKLTTEVTDRKYAEELLKENEERLKLMFDYAPDAYYLIDFEGRFLDGNKMSEKITGYNKEELLGKKFHESDLLAPDEVQKAVDILIKCTQGIDSGPGELVLIRKDGDTVEIEISVYPIKIKSQDVILGIARDITERKQAEEKRKKLELQLGQAQKMESIGTLAGGVAHDFNNLLMSIQGKTAVMLHNLDEDHTLYDQLKNIEQLIQSGSEVTSQLLGFAREGKLNVKPEDLNKLVKNSSKMFASAKKEIKVHRKYQKNVWAVEIDKNQIDQVLLNLFVNASQAMSKGGDLYIETKNVMLDEVYVKSYLVKPGRFVKMSFKDTGIGMDEATLQKIFDPFFTTKDVDTGTGLGLASAYGIIKNHNGIINAYSEKGVGSTFNIYLPVTDKKVIEDIKPKDRIEKGTQTILFIDDEQRVMEAGKDMLEFLGYQVITAASGKEAIEAYRKKNKMIDLVILDMILPEMDGSEIYGKLKDINSNVKVLLSSGFTQNEQAIKILDKGCNGFIQKPFTLEQLSQKISEILRKE
ncbi:MAG: PAS domain S-box protein [Deltaproteobacteria bacterium]|nr:PAS domain S-box protein [Deltaproteobacteria bacterium]